jgi:DNA-binding transcriptional ArsR family regulator
MTERGDPTDALSVLADETRADILRTLADADGPLSFSALRDRVGVRDSGRFSYHLRQLCEYFVRETDEGYELGHAGTRVVGAAGVTDGGADSAGATDGECPVCGESDCERLFHVHLSAPWR